ncbi:MAG: hypothetical protein ABF876_14285 [Acetobacter aceti]|uniref:Uncharacterized protein n=1 Tax=Acetobacter aceti TaxID=435 RepID=A0A1U9KJY0_ACEAC|nr:hypothetical protein [Acetobacter aceti]AQS86058.1 hypothetical protein A0U92_16335 [Acetobacter aceti]
MWKANLAFIVGLSIMACPVSSQAQIITATDTTSEASVQIINTPYLLQPENRYGAVWVALDKNTLKNGRTPLQKGSYGTVEAQEKVCFSSNETKKSKILVIFINTKSQPLTITSTNLSPAKSLSDASDRNKTLLVALDNMTLTDTITSGEEDNWRKGNPKKISLLSGSTAWIEPGIHTLKNVGREKSEFITIEW